MVPVQAGLRAGVDHGRDRGPWHRRDRGWALRALRESTALHQRLLREWPSLARRYRAALADLAGQDAWRKTLEATPPQEFPQAGAPPSSARTSR